MLCVQITVVNLHLKGSKQCNLLSLEENVTMYFAAAVAASADGSTKMCE